MSMNKGQSIPLLSIWVVVGAIGMLVGAAVVAYGMLLMSSRELLIGTVTAASSSIIVMVALWREGVFQKPTGSIKPPMK